MNVEILHVNLDHLEDAAKLFDAYRVFYEQLSDIEIAKQFLTDRINMNESVIFLAYCDGIACGFIQLFPVFSSVSAERSYILNDLYVLEQYRRKGIAKALLDVAKNTTIAHKYKGLALETHPDNPARKLYEKEGWVIDDEYVHYFWTNSSKGTK